MLTGGGFNKRNVFWNVESKTVSSMNLAACVLKPCWSICLGRRRRWLWTRHAQLRQTREKSLRAMRGSGRSTTKGKGGKFWVNDFISIIPMCTFCNTSLACMGEGEGISYGCSCLTNGDFDPLRAGSRANWSARWRDCGIF